MGKQETAWVLPQVRPREAIPDRAFVELVQTQGTPTGTQSYEKP